MRAHSTGVIAAASLIAVLAASVQDAEAFTRQRTVIGPYGGTAQNTVTRTPGQASRTTTRTTPGGLTYGRQIDAVRNGDGSASVNGSVTGPAGATRSGSATIIWE